MNFFLSLLLLWSQPVQADEDVMNLRGTLTIAAYTAGCKEEPSQRPVFASFIEPQQGVYGYFCFYDDHVGRLEKNAEGFVLVFPSSEQYKISFTEIGERIKGNLTNISGGHCQWEKATFSFEEEAAFEVDVHWASYYKALGLAQQARGIKDAAKALALIEKALALEPYSPELWESAVSIIERHPRKERLLHRWAKSSDKTKAGLGKRGTVARYYYTIGTKSYLAEQHEEALEALRKAAGLFPDEHIYACIAGGAALALGDMEETLHWFLQAVRQGFLRRDSLLQLQPNDYRKMAQTYLNGIEEILTTRPQWARQISDELKMLPDTPACRESVALWEKLTDDSEELYEITMDAKALEHTQAALALAEDHFGENSPYTSLALFNHAVVLLDLGYMGEAESLIRKCYQKRLHLYGEGHPATLDALGELAKLYANQGNMEASLELYKEIVSLEFSAYGPMNMKPFQTLHGIAYALENQGRIQEALNTYTEVYAAKHDLLGGLHPSMWITVTNISGLLVTLGEYETAAEMLLHTLMRAQGLFGPQYPMNRTILSNLSTIYTHLGNDELSTQFLDELETQFSLSEPVHKNVAILNNRALHEVLLGDDDSADAYYGKWLELSTEFLQQIHLMPSQAQRHILRMLEQDRHDYFSFYRQQSGRDTAAAFMRFSLHRKGVIHGAGAAFGRHVTARNPETQMLLENLRRKVAMARPPSELKAREYRDLEDQLTSLEVSLRQTTRDATLTLDQWLQSIPPDSVYVDFHVYEDFDKETMRKERSRNATQRVVALVAVRNEPLQWVDLGPSAKIKESLRSLRSYLNIPNRPTLTRYQAAQLCQHLWTPLEPLFRGKTKIIISPDDFIHLVPFAALVDDTGRYLAEKYQLRRSMQPKDILPQNENKPPSRPSILVYDLDHDAKPEILMEAAPLSWASFKPLSNSQPEGQALQKIFAAHELSVKPLTGGDIRETELLAIHSPKILHIATHGYSLENLPADTRHSRDLFQRREIYIEEEQEVSTFASHPLLRSGLALSGANWAVAGYAERDGSDGLLTAMEVQSMNLTGTELVVLSACSTGVGVLNSGDGIYSLNRAFLEAGAQAVLGTLWSVDDAGTRTFMEAFYKLYLGGLPADQALHRVQQRFMTSKKWAHPHYWAPFFLVGGSTE